MFKNKVLLFTKVNGQNRILKIKSVGKKSIVKYNKKALPIDLNLPIYQKKNVTFYAYDIEEGQLTHLTEIPNQHEEMIDLIMANEALKQLASTVDSNPFNLTTIVFLIMGIVTGLMIGIVVAPFIGLGG